MTTMASDVISFRMPHALKEKLEEFVAITKRSKSDLISHWIEDAMAIEEWQLQEIQLGVEEANAGKFASQQEVNQVLQKWR